MFWKYIEFLHVKNAILSKYCHSLSNGNNMNLIRMTPHYHVNHDRVTLL